MFAQILFALEQAPGQHGVFTGGLPSWGRSGQRFRKHPAGFDPHQPLGCGSDKTLAGTIRHRESVTAGIMLAQVIKHAERVEFLVRGQLLRPGEHDFLIVTATNLSERLSHATLVRTHSTDLHNLLRCRRPTAILRGGVIEGAKLRMRLPDFRGHEIKRELRCNQEIGHCHRTFPPARHLPAWYKHAQGRKRRGPRGFVRKAARHEKMRSGKTFPEWTDRDGVFQRAGNELFRCRESRRTRGREFQHGFGPGHRQPVRRPLDVEMQLGGLED